jgi:hypothetical protein
MSDLVPPRENDDLKRKDGEYREPTARNTKDRKRAPGAGRKIEPGNSARISGKDNHGTGRRHISVDTGRDNDAVRQKPFINDSKVRPNKKSIEDILRSESGKYARKFDDQIDSMMFNVKLMENELDNNIDDQDIINEINLEYLSELVSGKNGTIESFLDDTTEKMKKIINNADSKETKEPENNTATQSATKPTTTTMTSQDVIQKRQEKESKKKIELDAVRQVMKSQEASKNNNENSAKSQMDAKKAEIRESKKNKKLTDGNGSIFRFKINEEE